MRNPTTRAALTAAALITAVAQPLPAQTRGVLPMHRESDTQPDRVDTTAIRAHTRFLADDLLRGRAAGSEGERLAAAYIESQLIRMGLQPAGATSSFLQPVPLAAVRIDEGTQLVATTGTGARTWSSPTDFIVNTGGAAAFRDFSGRVLFAGSPLEAGPVLRDVPELDGTVIAMLGLPGAAAIELIPDWIRRGVRGVLILAPDSAYYELVSRSRGDERLLVAAAVDDPVWQPALPTLVLGPALSEALLAEAAARQAARPAAQRATAVPLGWQIDVTIRTTRRELQAANVVGLVPGTDPALRDEFVVYTAHYDHLGVGPPDADGDSIYSGFSDNAAGVAMLLAIAERLRTEPPLRSVLFLFFTAEERGLLGSTYYTAAPLQPLERIRGVINLDAGAPPAPPTSWRVAAGVGSESLTRHASTIAQRRGWRVDVGAATPNSDHWPFAARGVPAIFLIPGAEWENTSPDAATRLRERFERYHQPGDRWHHDFPFAGLGRYADFALELGRAAANDVP